MKKITQFTLCLTLFFSSAYSQKELWGYSLADAGMIIKAPLEGTNQDAEVMHTFDPTGVLGKYPHGRPFQASNGKLYGITTFSGGPEVPQGILFEYDPILNLYKVLVNSAITADINGNLYGLTEPLPGLLYGTTNGGNSIFKYDIATEEFTIVASIPVFYYNSSPYRPQFCGELMKAADGYMYGATQMAPSSQNTPYPGGIYKFNLITNQITKVYVFAIDGTDVYTPMYDTKLVEGSPGKLYGTAFGGQNIGPQGVAPSGSGTIFEFTIATSALVKKYDFNYATIGSYPSPLIKSADNKLYGALFGLSNNFNNYPNAGGSVYEYNLDTNALTILHAFVYNDDDGVQYPSGIAVKASDGNFYGSSFSGIYKYNPVTDVVNKKINSDTAYVLKDVIEICRKPSYHFFDTSSFTVCQNTPFTFDVQNDNATGFVWRRGSAVLPAQTTGVLNIASLTPADTGIYTCTMTNECGTTVTMPLQLTIEACLGIDQAIGFKNTIALYPNPATNILNLKLPDAPSFEIQQISISNMLGQTVYSSANKTTTIDISSLKTGMYQVLLATDKGNWNGRFIKE